MFGVLFRFNNIPSRLQYSDLQNYSWTNSMWNSFITMCTIGYGDFYPKAQFGRIVAVFCALAGIYIKSLLTASFLDIFDFNRTESVCYKIITGVQKSIDLKLKAALLINSIFKLKKDARIEFVKKYSRSKTRFKITSQRLRRELFSSITSEQHNVMFTQTI